MIYEHLTRIKTDGTLPPRVSEEIRAELKSLAGKRVMIRVAHISTRSDQQNRYLHWLFTIASTELIQLTGDSSLTKDRVKDMAKLKFLRQAVVDQDGVVIGETLGQTHKLNKDECSEFTSKFIGWMADDFNIHLPLPNEQREISY